LKYSSSKENYIKAVFHLQQAEEVVSTNSLARALCTKPASVTDMLKKLKTQKLLQYEPYKGVKLSADGKKLALQIIRKHRLWEFFLVEKLGFGWEEVHEIAEELEHITSKQLIDRLDHFLGSPKTDPHGDPIPDSMGKMRQQEQTALTDLPFNQLAEIVQVRNQSTQLLELLRYNNIGIGTMLKVLRRFEFDRSLEICISEAPFITISEQLATNLYVTHAATRKS
jgi:DtxR family transcriptional regulator, Mn-dependent transcriptional regulator